MKKTPQITIVEQDTIHSVALEGNPKESGSYIVWLAYPGSEMTGTKPLNSAVVETAYFYNDEVGGYRWHIRSPREKGQPGHLISLLDSYHPDYRVPMVAAWQKPPTIELLWEQDLSQ